MGQVVRCERAYNSVTELIAASCEVSTNSSKALQAGVDAEAGKGAGTATATYCCWAVVKCHAGVLNSQRSTLCNSVDIDAEASLAGVHWAMTPSLDISRFNSGSRIGFRFRLDVQALTYIVQQRGARCSQNALKFIYVYL
jgi:hypothetical protein